MNGTIRYTSLWPQDYVVLFKTSFCCFLGTVRTRTFLARTPIGHIRISSLCWTGTRLQLRLMRGNIIKKRLISFAIETAPRISLSCKLVTVQYREYENGIFDFQANLILTYSVD